MRMEFRWMRLLLLGLALALFAGRPVSAEGPEVIYDKATDRLSVQADRASLKGLLSRITLLSGVEFLIDMSVEQPVSIVLKDSPLEKGLKQIMRSLNLSYATIYQKKEGQDQFAEPLLITMKIVPKGMESLNLNLVPVIAEKGEAVVRSLSSPHLRDGQRRPSIFDYAEKRWQARLNRMSAAKRKQIEDDLKRREEERKTHMEERERHRAEREKRKEEDRARRQADEEELRVSNPELYELRRQRREELRQKLAEELGQ